MFMPFYLLWIEGDRWIWGLTEGFAGVFGVLFCKGFGMFGLGGLSERSILQGLGRV